MHGDDDRPEIPAALRQHILVARRAFAVAASLEKTGLDQSRKAPRQHVGRDAQALLELVEARQPVQGIAEDENAPPLADPFQAAGDRALHFAEAFALHGSRIAK